MAAAAFLFRWMSLPEMERIEGQERGGRPGEMMMKTGYTDTTEEHTTALARAIMYAMQSGVQQVEASGVNEETCAENGSRSCLHEDNGGSFTRAEEADGG